MKNKKKVLITLMGVLLVATLIPLIGYAAVPQQITYQGQLTDQYGDPVPDGDYDMTFALYDVPTGGTALWAEAQTVTVTDGIYNVILGHPRNFLDPNDFDGDLYLGVTVGTDAEMTPRQPITSVGYALRAAVADTVAEGAVTEIMIEDNAVTTAKVADNAITESKIGDGTVTYVKIQDGATLAEITDDDGAGSKLDADLIDGQDSSAFMPAGADNWVDEAGDSMTGQLNIKVASGDGLSSINASSTGRGVYGLAYATSGLTRGVYGQSDSTSGSGVYGEATATSGSTRGVLGLSNSTSGSGVRGYASATSGTTYGVFGGSSSTDGHGVYGEANATSGKNYGVYGRSSSTSGSGVYGRANATSGTSYGVYGVSDSTSGRGVYGAATAASGTTYGVQGHSNSTDGSGIYGLAYATSGLNRGVFGMSLSTDGHGVYGEANATSGKNYGVYGRSLSTSGTGVHGYAEADYGDTYGVWGQSNSPIGSGVYGYASASVGGTGVYAYAPNGTGLYARGGTGIGDWAGTFVGNVRIQNQSEVTTIEINPDFNGTGDGRIITSELQITGGSDLSEQFDIHKAKVDIKPGMLVSIHEKLPGELVVSTEAYDNKVAGIISGAGGIKPGMMMGQRGSQADGVYPVVLTGRVYCWADASKGPIKPGDLLTTSNLPGHAMKVKDHSRALGAIIGKAMTSLEEGRDLVLVLVSLQ